MPNKKQRLDELEQVGAPKKTANLIAKAERGDAPVPDTHGTTYTEDKRTTAREDGRHFSNRADFKGQ